MHFAEVTRLLSFRFLVCRETRVEVPTRPEGNSV